MLMQPAALLLQGAAADGGLRGGASARANHRATRQSKWSAYRPSAGDGGLQARHLPAVQAKWLCGAAGLPGLPSARRCHGERAVLR
jgi:hypothetical protein